MPVRNWNFAILIPFVLRQLLLLVFSFLFILCVGDLVEKLGSKRCEPFSTYPRTYDLLHLDGLFTVESHRCEMKFILLEMDQILRPSGYVIIRESDYFIDSISTIAKGIKWGCEKKGTEVGVEKEKLLICQKKLWYSKMSQD